MGGKVVGYLDCASPYSYFGIKYLREQRKLLEQYDVEVEFVPFFLGGVNAATGNKPPTTLPARAAYAPYDMKRACVYFDTVPLSGPPFFPMPSLLPQRCMVAIKDVVSVNDTEKFETVFERCWIYCFNLHKDLSQPDMMRELLHEFFDRAQTDEILRLAASKEIKDKLLANTKDALDRGAFGAPWWWVTSNKNEKGEPIFGSDRLSYMFRLLGVEVQELAIVDKDTKASGMAKL